MTDIKYSGVCDPDRRDAANDPLFQPGPITVFTPEENLLNLPERNLIVATIFDKYNEGIEPIESWETEDIITVIDALYEELENRTECYVLEDNPNRYPTPESVKRDIADQTDWVDEELS